MTTHSSDIIIKLNIISLSLSLSFLIVKICSHEYKGILFGRAIDNHDGSKLIPVFFPVSWFVHDIYSAKLANSMDKIKDEMMTSDTNPDAQGNFRIQSKKPLGTRTFSDRSEPLISKNNNNYIQRPIGQQPIDQQPIDQQPNDQQPIDQQPIDQQPIDSELNQIEDAHLKFAQETEKNRQIANESLEKEVLWKPPGLDDDMTDAQPVFTTVEVYEVPGIDKYIGLSSNKSVLHESPDDNSTKTFIKRFIR